MSDPVALMAAIDADAFALDDASKQLADLTGALAQAEVAYEDAMDKALSDIEEEYRERGEKLPSERQREAHARPRVNPQVRNRYMELSRRAKLIGQWGEMRARALSARQSELSFLKAEGGAPAQQPSWSNRRAAA